MFRIILIVIFVLFSACNQRLITEEIKSPKARILVEAAMAQIGKTVSYDAAYVDISYPDGDVPLETGVCADVVVRALRNVDVDLQMLIHEDMMMAFPVYPNLWGLNKPDSNIDHRRVPNIMKFLERRGKALPITDNPKDYLPGDIIAWKLPNNLFHIGIVSNSRLENMRHFFMIHNFGRGALLQDVLFRYKIIGHYRYF